MHPNYHVLILLVVGGAGMYLLRGLIAWRQERLLKNRRMLDLQAMRASTAVWVVRVLAGRYHFDRAQAARTLANNPSDLGPAFEQAFGLRWNDREGRWYVPRRRRQGEAEILRAEPKVDLRIKDSPLSEAEVTDRDET